MKKWFLLILPVLLIALFLVLPALAEEGADLTEQCALSASSGGAKISRLMDRDYGTAFVSDKQRAPSVEITAPKGASLHGVYVCFGGKLVPWRLEAKHGGKWVAVYESQGLYAHEYAPLPEGETALRLKPSSDKQQVLVISELYVFGPGDTPSFVQTWQPAPEKADLLFIAAHPDDEILFFGGAIPTYAGEKGLNVVVAYMTCGNMEDLIKHNKPTTRRSELLNGLWEMGVRTYPVIWNFWDKYAKTMEKEYDAWGRTATYQAMVLMLRQFKPEVVVTHDVGGEYGHAGHKVCADAIQRCIETAAGTKYPDSLKQYGSWQVKKLYLHLYKQNAVEMDWDQPLSFFGGRTGYEVALDAFVWHPSQHEAGQKNPETGKFEYFTVEPRESNYSCYRFGLAYTAVGPDVERNDFFENIPGY